MTLMLWFACTPEFSPPDDAGLAGGPVGVRTEQVGGLTVEVWYPAHPRTEGPEDAIDFRDALSAAVLERLGDPEVPEVPGGAVRDAEPHPDGPFPAIVFSHGFGGTRQQSVTLTSHLASRGHVVVATDHAGRSLGDLVPCLFSPALDGCALAFDDPAPPHVRALADWLESPPDWLPVDAGGIGLFGHSAGGNTTVSVGDVDARFTALAPMAGGGPVARAVPVQRWAGTCDGIVPAAGSLAAHEASTGGSYVELVGAGHLAFSDLCALDLGGLVESLAARDDVSPLLLGQIGQLAVDGCPGAEPVPELVDCGPGFLPIEDSDPLLKAELAAFFSLHLRGEGEGPSAAGSGPLRVR